MRLLETDADSFTGWTLIEEGTVPQRLAAGDEDEPHSLGTTHPLRDDRNAEQSTLAIQTLRWRRK
ncbi:hypothetical protein [Rhodopirellula sp. P2]|uniref:hypothetical protein n=1 Tax=Rhodopirellula sp. P2 TaxID=2127060 RepID=UPI002368E306|nr:hypothetical protein [Rhodopirellula sp. P2]WDQ14869.1 hypothetical protein PSR62_14600 [Rhodopirellula sp. P2]